MTRPQIRLYWHYREKRKFREWETQAAMWGYDPKKAKASSSRKRLAEKWQMDPLFGFPNDIDYFSRQQIQDKIAVSKRFWTKMDPESRWDQDRGSACIGRSGLVARRCSMNDRLWGLWRQAKAKGVTLTLDQVKKMIRIDIARSRLYPQGWTDDRANPPEWYMDELREKGMLEKILNDIDEVTKS